jgi:hypothetical protein
MGATVRRSNAGFPKKRRWITEKTSLLRDLFTDAANAFRRAARMPLRRRLAFILLKSEMNLSFGETRVSN